MESFDKICKILDQYQYVSFDVFDTLIFRTITNPKDIFELVSRSYESKNGKKCQDFSIKRSYAESVARAYYSTDITIDDIYKFIDYPLEKSQLLKDIEKECEIDNCIGNQIMVDILLWCKSKNKKILITSDMYLTKDVFDRIFNKIGVTYDYIFISGENEKTKKTGLLFEHVLKTLDISCEEVVHIGDDIHNDIEMPRHYGIRSILRLTNDGIKAFYLSSKRTIEENHLYNLFQNTYKNQKTSISEFRIGYTVYGPFLYSYCKWINQVKKEMRMEHLFFLARDGFLIKKVYDLIFPEEKAYTQYIYLNKNLLRLPSLAGDMSVSKFILSLPPRKDYRWNELASHLFIEDIEELFRELHCKCKSFLSSQTLSLVDIQKGKYDDQIDVMLNFCRDKIVEQRKYLDEYLNKLGFYNKKIGLVNNSMQGSVQKMLYNIAKDLGKTIDVYGLQFTASNSCIKTLNKNLSVFWGKGNDYQVNAAFFRGRCLLFEHFLFEPCGTASYFFRDNTGKVCVELKKISKESLDKEVIERIQNNVLAFVHDYISHIPLRLNDLPRKMMNNMFSKPYKDDALLMGNLWDEDVEGTRKICNFNMPVPPKTILFRRFSPDYGWDMGYFVVKQLPQWFLLLWRARIRLFIYLRNRSYIYDDILYLIKSLLLLFASVFKKNLEIVGLLYNKIKIRIAIQ